MDFESSDIILLIAIVITNRILLFYDAGVVNKKNLEDEI